MGGKKKTIWHVSRCRPFFNFRRELDFPASFTLRATFSIQICAKVCRLIGRQWNSGHPGGVWDDLQSVYNLEKYPFKGCQKRGCLNTVLSPAAAVIMSQFIFKKSSDFLIFLQCSVRAVVFLPRVRHTGLERANRIRCFFQSRACRQPPTVLCVRYACRFVPLAKRTECAAKR